MSDESGRSVLTDFFIFALIIGLGLAAIYFSGNWAWFTDICEKVVVETQIFLKEFVGNIQSLSGNVNEVKNLSL